MDSTLLATLIDDDDDVDVDVGDIHRASEV